MEIRIDRRREEVRFLRSVRTILQAECCHWSFEGEVSIPSRKEWLHNDGIIVVARFIMMLSTTSILRTTSSSGIAGQTLESLPNHAVSYLAEPKAAVVL